MAHYEQDEHDTGLPDRAKEWIDERVYGGLSATGRGTLEVLGSGFGKGLLVAAALTVAAYLGIAAIAPSVLALEGLSVASAMSSGLSMAGNFLLTGGIWVPLAGGAIGSMIAAHSENNRIGKDAAESQASLYAQARQGQVLQPSLSQDQTMDYCHHVSGGHCAKLMQEQHEQREFAR